jgi:hypothetical protein
MDHAEWNAAYPPGTAVLVTKADGSQMRAYTAAPAQRVGVFEMVELFGYRGLWLLALPPVRLAQQRWAECRPLEVTVEGPEVWTMAERALHAFGHPVGLQNVRARRTIVKPQAPRALNLDAVEAPLVVHHDLRFHDSAPRSWSAARSDALNLRYC